MIFNGISNILSIFFSFIHCQKQNCTSFFLGFSPWTIVKVKINRLIDQDKESSCVQSEQTSTLRSPKRHDGYLKPKWNWNAICRPLKFYVASVPSALGSPIRLTISLANHHAIILIQVSFIFRFALVAERRRLLIPKTRTRGRAREREGERKGERDVRCSTSVRNFEVRRGFFM